MTIKKRHIWKHKRRWKTVIVVISDAHIFLWSLIAIWRQTNAVLISWSRTHDGTCSASFSVPRRFLDSWLKAKPYFPTASWYKQPWRSFTRFEIDYSKKKHLKIFPLPTIHNILPPFSNRIIKKVLNRSKKDTTSLFILHWMSSNLGHWLPKHSENIMLPIVAGFIFCSSWPNFLLPIPVLK